MTYPESTGGYLGAARGCARALGFRERGNVRAVAPLLLFALSVSACSAVTQGLQATSGALTRADKEILEQCADLDNPANAARIDALALIFSGTQEIENVRTRREAYCAFKRAQVQ